MATIFVRNGKRFNIYAPAEIDGVRYPNFLDPSLREKLSIEEIPNPERESEITHFVNEIDEAPYVINTPKPIKQVREYVWQKIKAHRDMLQESGVQVGGYWLHNDVKSRTQWERMATRTEFLLANGASESDAYEIAGQQVNWKTMTGDKVPVTLGLIRDVVSALELREATIFQVAETHREAILVLEDVKAVASYNWNTGWPQTFEEWLAAQE